MCTCYRYCLFRDLQVSLVDTMYLQPPNSLDVHLICIGKNQFQADGLNILAALWVLRWQGPCHQGTSFSNATEGLLLDPRFHPRESPRGRDWSCKKELKRVRYPMWDIQENQKMLWVSNILVIKASNDMHDGIWRLAVEGLWMFYLQGSWSIGSGQSPKVCNPSLLPTPELPQPFTSPHGRQHLRCGCCPKIGFQGPLLWKHPCKPQDKGRWFDFGSIICLFPYDQWCNS